MNASTDPTQAIFREMGFPAQRAWQHGAVAYSIARTSSLLVRELSKVYKRAGLTAASFNLLMLLRHGADSAEMTQQAIGKRLVVSPSDMTGLIDRLERRGLVRRRPGRDRRMKLLQITGKGEQVLDAIWPAHLAAIRGCCEGLAAPDAKRLVRALATLREGLA